MTGPAESLAIVPPVQRAIQLLQHIGAGNSCTNISLTAKTIGINRTTLQRLLNTLLTEGMIEQLPSGAGYQLGIGLAMLASNAIFSRDIVQVSQPILRDLAVKIGLSAHLGVREGQCVVYLVRETPNLHLVSNVSVGSRLPAHATTIGRIILANLPLEELQEFFSVCDFAASTSLTSTTADELSYQLANDKHLGVAWSVGNFEPGIGSCASPIYDHTSRVVGAINLTGPDHHFHSDEGRREEIAKELLLAGEAISMQLGSIPDKQVSNPIDRRSL